MGVKWLFLAHFWSLDEVVGDLRSRVRTSVRSSVRSSVRHAFSRKPFITFFLKLYSWLGLVSARKMFQALF